MTGKLILRKSFFFPLIYNGSRNIDFFHVITSAAIVAVDKINLNGFVVDFS